ncbi:sugar-transfer associated ATP-grasp domain-containing protein [Natronolimnohabitans sp. A-GB9]|uniref:sugar-transfer associated ATP-grasp domain-containing protein n=1 Tax=Natronolimnohabitans sp. A-GB9 TaxID=3069757 RepID=UPI0027B10553|nr:sugar-transfer associated ATP-grasp domain-containing protein [Natronolimnohabitans sp. A-GB9]MDQ2052698.1 sugar-transfer associated ATP-grasp domain-containing protein [Natronolimnohabitans sp. A-GB9]
MKSNGYVVIDNIVNFGSLSPSEHIDAVRKGYRAEMFSLYGFDDGVDESDYLSSVDRLRAGIINQSPDLLDNKLSFHKYMNDRDLQEYLPTLYGRIKNGKFISEEYDSINHILENKRKLVIKGITGGGGKDVYICTLDNEQAVLLGRGGNVSHLSEKSSELNNMIVTEYCDQANYIKRIYPESANTIRVLTIHPDHGDPFIAGAAHRIGSSQSGTLDNFTQRGLSARINLETGELGKAASRLETNKLRWHDSHPSTDELIEGTQIPGWESIKEQLVEITRKTPELKYVGWDIIVTSPGEFKILEGNSYPNPRVIQIHDPLLKDSRVRRFFRKNGIKI